MEIKIKYDNTFSHILAKTDKSWLEIDILDDGEVWFEFDEYRHSIVFTIEQLRLLADTAERLQKDRHVTKDDEPYDNGTGDSWPPN